MMTLWKELEAISEIATEKLLSICEVYYSLLYILKFQFVTMDIMVATP